MSWGRNGGGWVRDGGGRKRGGGEKGVGRERRRWREREVRGGNFVGI